MQRDYTTPVLSAWAGIAHCQDDSHRPVVTYLLGDELVLVSRGFTSLLYPHVLGISLGSAHFLDFLLSIADFEVIDGVWTARVSATCIALACATGQARNTIYQQIKALAEQQFLDYTPAQGGHSPALIRVPLVHRRTGFIMFAASPDWRAGFIRAVAPKFRLVDIPVKDRRAADSLTADQFGSLWKTIPTTLSPMSS